MTPPQESNSEAPNTLVGRVIANNFRVDRLLGSGATGNVYKAEQLSLGKAVAIKVLHPQLMADEKLVRRFQREAKSASRLNHPNSVQIIDSGQDAAGTLYIAMELLSGRDLSEVIRDEFPLPVPRIVHIMSQVFAALDEAHAHGIIHRDLKPSNIMLIERRDEKDFVKVCDYGIAKAASEDSSVGTDSQMLTVQGLVCGTPEYMSPEQARGEVLDGRTDLYSAAVILYQLATGDVPFRAATPIGIVSRHLSEIPIVPSLRRADAGVPSDLDDLILRGLAKSRDLRPATAAIFRDELQRLGSGPGRRALANARTLPATDPSTNEGATTAELVSPSARRGSGWLVAIGLGTVALLAVGAAFVLRRNPPPMPASDSTVAIAAPRPPALAMARGADDHEAPRAATAEPSAPAAGTGPSSDTAAPEATASAPEATPAALRERPGHRRLAAAGQRGSRQTGATARTAGEPGETASATAAPGGEGAAGPVASPGASSSADDKPGTAAPAAAASAAAPAGSGGPSVHGPREVVAEAEKLLGQGEVAEACRRGEEAKRAAPKLPPVFKFLGKCYMRAGNAGLAKENFRHYLELAPNAPDAVFIESIVKERAK